MTIEATLERIADALEAIAGSATSATPAPEKPKAEKPKAEKPKAEKPKAEKPKAEASDEAPDIGEVREALKALQKATDAGTAKGILESFEVSTLSALDASLYGDVIAAAAAAAE